MRRDPRELAIMRERWKRETAHHMDPKTGEPHRKTRWLRDADGRFCGLVYVGNEPECQCVKGYGYFRKRAKEDHGSNWIKFVKRLDRRYERQDGPRSIAKLLETESGFNGWRLVGKRRVSYRIPCLD